MAGQWDAIPACGRNHIANAGLNLSCAEESGLGSEAGT